MKGFIDIPCEELKKAIESIEKKQGVCKKLPSARFKWTHSRVVSVPIIHDAAIQVGTLMPNIGKPSETSEIIFGGLVCDQLGGQSTGIGAEKCTRCMGGE